jgi:hypothetical protein
VPCNRTLGSTVTNFGCCSGMCGTTGNCT